MTKVLCAALGLAVAAAACDVTQVVVVLDAPSAVEARAAIVHVSVCNEDGARVLDRRLDVPGAVTFPARVPLHPAGGAAARRFALLAELFDGAGARLGAQRAFGGYVDGEALEVARTFDEACVSDPGCGPSETCVRGSCENAALPWAAGVDPPCDPAAGQGELDVVLTSAADPRVVVRRASIATYYDESGTLRTAAPDEARVDHDPHGAPLGMLVERGTVNHVPWSSAFDRWSVVGAVEADAEVAPDATMTADRITLSGAGESALRLEIDGLGALPGRTFTLSMWMKGTIASDWPVRLGLMPVDTCWTELIAVSALDVRGTYDEWTRVAFTGTIRESCGHAPSALYVTVGCLMGGCTASYTGVLSLWGAQLEEGPGPTSYVPTEGASRSREADSVEVTHGPWLEGDAISVGLRLTPGPTFGADQVLWWLGRGADPGTGASMTVAEGGHVRVLVTEGGTTLLDAAPTAAPVWTPGLSRAVAWSSGGAGVLAADDGVIIVEDATIPHVAIDRLMIASDAGGMRTTAAHLERIVVLPRALVPEAMRMLTQP